MNHLNDDLFLREICRHLDASIAHLPLSVSQQLDASRQAALTQTVHLDAPDTEGLAQSVRQEFAEGSEQLPADIEARLDQIRHSAVARFEELQRTPAQSSRFSMSAWIKSQLNSFNFGASAGMLATACVMITAISIFYVNSRPAGTLTLEDEIGLVATAEDIELYENLEFYMWLSENETFTL